MTEIFLLLAAVLLAVANVVFFFSMSERFRAYETLLKTLDKRLELHGSRLSYHGNWLIELEAKTRGKQ